MDYATTFYVLGGILAALAVVTSFIGLRFGGFPGKMGPLVVLVFVALVGAAATFAVLNGQHEQEARASETAQAGEVIEKEEESPPVEAQSEGPSGEAESVGEGTEKVPSHPGSKAPAHAGAGSEKASQGGGKAPTGGGKAASEGGKAAQGGEGGGQSAGGGPGGTLQLAADPTQIAFDKTTLSSKPGKVTIEFTNPSALEHDVAIEQGGKRIAVSPRITEGKTSISAQLAPGTYTFLCTVPGHAEAGMEGTLTVR